MNELAFNGKNFLDFSAQVTKSTFLRGAERDVTLFSVLGRNGVLSTDNGRFKEVPLVTEVAVKGDMQNNIEAMRNFLKASRGFCRYEESLCPDEFRLATYVKQFNPDKYDHLGAHVKLEFTAQPQRWLKSGEIPISIPQTMGILNPTLHDAEPLIKVTGTGTIQIGNITATISQHSFPYIYIDCEMMECYYESNRAGEFVELTNHEYPVLKPGLNNIVLDGVTLEITPRWYNI